MPRSRSVPRPILESPPAELAAAARAPGRRPWSLRRPNELDLFLLVNAILFVLMCIFAYHDKWVRYVGTGRTVEFVLYAIVVLAVMVGGRLSLPDRPFPPALLVLIQVWVMAGFAGGFVHFAGERLYDHWFLGLRYDKLVHGLAALVTGLIVLELLHMRGLRVAGFVRLVAAFASLGVLAVWELMEAVVRAQGAGRGIGGNEDALPDMTANLVGGLLFLVVGGRVHRSFRRARGRDGEVVS